MWFQLLKGMNTSPLVVPTAYTLAIVVLTVSHRNILPVLGPVTDPVACSISESFGLQRTDFHGCPSRFRQIPRTL
jgi:hypothetical protein